MSDYSLKLSSIAEKRQKLLEEEKRLIEKRKQEIADLAERCDALTAPTPLIAGLFVMASKALQDNSPQIKEWETIGARFLKPSRNRENSKKGEKKANGTL